MLLLGGTGWLGREIARAAIRNGHEVTCLARGDSGEAAEGARLVRADRRDPDAYSLLSGHWDDVIELNYAPDLVVSALDALADSAAHWTLVSTVSVYAHSGRDADETAAVVEPQDLSQYPDAKVAAERASSRLGDRLLIARPGLIVGPGDPSDRFGYWPARLDLGGRVLVPKMAGRFVQVIDVADLAAWISGATSITGIVNAVGAAHPMEHFFQIVAEVTRFRGELVEVDDTDLVAHGVQYWAGPRSLPLWLPESDSAFAQRSGAAYLATGGRLRPLEETVRRVLEDERTRDRPRRSGLTAGEEAAVLAACVSPEVPR